MRRPLLSPSLAPAVILAAATLVALTPELASAQGQLPQPPVGLRAPPPAPIKPYQPVAAMPPGPFSDPSFAAFRKNLADAAQHKDRAALAKLIIAQGFFWVQDKDVADKSKSGIDNLSRAIGLDAPDGAGWDILAGDADDPTAAELQDNKGLFCAPAPPNFDAKAFETMVQDTGTDPTDWGYPPAAGVEVRAAARANAQVIDKLGLYFVRVLQDTAPAAGGQQFLHVALPNGKTGFIPADAILPLATDQICYTKEADGWKIAGYIGGGQP